MKTIAHWFETRTGLISATASFFREEIPASSGWHQVFGSVAMFSFLVQVFTGVLLALNFAPASGEAHASMKYILMEVTGGRLIRQLHHWGASLMIVIVVLHMVQVFLWGAYKKPREATWISGAVLLLLTFGYGLTGYLLPWDNRAYWGTVVAVQIAGTAPVLGAYAQQLLGAPDGQIGAVTFARFYTLHVVLLPLASFALIALHVMLVRRHGVAPQPGDEAKPLKPFYPGQVFKDTVAIFIAFVILYVLAIAVRVPLEQMANPVDTNYVPRPDWYFLFLFQLLKFFEGPLEVFGTVILPTLAILLLIAVPFLDRNPVVPVVKRTVAFAMVLLAGAGWAALTYSAAAATPASKPFDVTLVEPWQEATPKQLALSADGAPAFAVEAAALYNKLACGACHRVNGEGGKSGPVLNGLLFRRDREWIEGHFLDPQKFSPGTPMPPYRFAPAQMEAMVRWLLALPPE
jgi:ubiquinol-cytochrome c reductase cytochrome b subunit